MNSFRQVSLWAVGLVWLAVGVGCAYAVEKDAKPGKEEAVAPLVQTIPLDQIWGCDMPRTIDFRELSKKLVGKIPRVAWTIPPKYYGKVGPGFAVLGTGVEALGQVSTIIAEDKKPQQTFPANSEVSVFFFSCEVTYYVHLDRVERRGNMINIRYRFVPHETEDMTSHSALIPLGKLSSGEYRVNVSQTPTEQRKIGIDWPPISDKYARRVVCNSFTFSVLEKGK